MKSSHRKSRSVYLYEEVYNYIQTRMERGEWKKGDKLPSIRELSSILQVHRLTVFKAYQQLKIDKKVTVKDKSGYYILDHSPLITLQTDDHIQNAFLHKSTLSEIHQIPVKFQFSQALIDPNLLPNRYFSEYVKKVFDLYPKVLGTYSTVQGDEELRETLANYFRKKHNLHVEPEELLITSGSQQAINLIAHSLIKPRDTVLMERPTYSAAIDIFRGQGANILTVDIYQNGYNMDIVEQLMKKHKPRLFYLNPTFHNPTGYTVPTEQRKQLVELAEKYKCLLVEDDPFHDIYFDKAPPAPLFTYDSSGYVMYISSYSKYVAPGLRIGVVASRQPLMKILLTAKSLADNGTPLLNQKMFLHYFTSERMQQHLEKLRIALQIRKEIMEDALSQSELKWVSPNGGLNLWVKLPSNIDSMALLSKCVEQSVSFVPGHICDSRNQLHSWIRLSYSFASEKDLKEGIEKLCYCLRTL
ncbi:aminotransferase-like domain-containing protein [Litchfieldia salsa]|uniref:DNA-binding transcriptional regulator, MocR family, contains an aminotransferase domain n=1 Tax=Litchfieldia salsa TaxID=930152 RepID=A0A1H0RRS1_9BACI|nr:PLP-dependent aminotransferase family protein [Litchfieldia salsa]SDP32095.1 DNA-binding transcriptional regulator, MocR family, contains an aminotransferase domain [Litchfieldia salsa]